jgi:hypothetical protein
MFGYSFVNERQVVVATLATNEGYLPVHFVTNPQHINSLYGDYSIGKLHLATEFRRNREIGPEIVAGVTSTLNESDKEWFGSIAYRINKRFEVGAYNSRFYVDQPTVASDPNAHHIFDQVAAVRVDLKRWWNVKLEGHFMNGYGDIYSAHGFYLRSNPNGTKPNTDMLVLRTAFWF